MLTRAVASYSWNIAGVKFILALAGLLNCSGMVIDAPAAKPFVEACIIGAPLC